MVRSLENKVTVCFGAALIMLCVAVVVSYQSISHFIIDSRWDNHTYQVLASVSALQAELGDAEGAGRGYVITGDENFLGLWRVATTRIDPALQSLRSLTVDNHTQQLRIQILRPLIERKVGYFEALVRLRRDRGFDGARPLLLTADAVPLAEQIRTMLKAMTAAENSLLTTRIPQTESNARRSIALITVGAISSLILVSLAVWLIYRSVAARKRAEIELSTRTTELEAVDDELRLTSERFQSFEGSAKEYAVFMLDPQGLVKNWNAGAQRLKGYQAGEIIGQHFSCFYSAEDVRLGKPSEELRIAIADGLCEETGWRFRKGGSRFWARVLVTPMYDSQGVHIGFSKITRDLTDRTRAAEQTLNFFTLSLDLLCIAGTDGYFKRLNLAWEKTLGFSEEELCAVPSIDFVHPDDRAATTAFNEESAAGIQGGQFENRYRCKDGSYRWLMWKSAVSSDLQLVYAAASDVTDRKRIEDEVAALNQTLQRQNLELESTNKELEAFSYSVSHDLRAPLRSLDGFSQALLEDYADKLDDQGRNYLGRVRAGSQRMGQLIDDLLDLSRVSRVEIKRELVDLSKMALEIAEELRAAAPQRDAEFVVADGLVAETDSHLMRIVLTNLLDNAWKFTAKQPHARIEFGCSGESGSREYFTRDNGAGFDETYSSKLFGAFQRLHAFSDFSGTGIGLATVKRIIQRQGGRVWAEGKVAQGATFHFTL